MLLGRSCGDNTTLGIESPLNSLKTGSTGSLILQNAFLGCGHELVVHKVWLSIQGYKPLPDPTANRNTVCATFHHGDDGDVAHRVSDRARTEACEAVHGSVDRVLGQVRAQLRVSAVRCHRPDGVSWIDCSHVDVHPMLFLSILLDSPLKEVADIVVDEVAGSVKFLDCRDLLVWVD